MNTLRTIAALFAFLLFVLCSSPSFAADQASNREQDITTTLVGLERSKFSAQQQQDTAVLNALFDDGLMWVDQNGVLSTKAAYLSGLRDARETVYKIAPESMTVKVFATAATVIGIYNETGREAGRTFHRRCRFIDTWARKKGKWVCIAVTATPVIS